jgi:hypothetical protein
MGGLGLGRGKGKSEMRGSLHCGGKLRRLRSRWRLLLGWIQGKRTMANTTAGPSTTTRKGRASSLRMTGFFPERGSFFA